MQKSNKPDVIQFKPILNSIQPHSRQFNQKTSQFNQIAAAEDFVLVLNSSQVPKVLVAAPFDGTNRT
jgi:hypothetical protein